MTRSLFRSHETGHCWTNSTVYCCSPLSTFGTHFRLNIYSPLINSYLVGHEVGIDECCIPLICFGINEMSIMASGAILFCGEVSLLHVGFGIQGSDQILIEQYWLSTHHTAPFKMKALTFKILFQAYKTLRVFLTNQDWGIRKELGLENWPRTNQKNWAINWKNKNKLKGYDLGVT